MSIWRDEIGRALAEVHSLEEQMRLDGAPVYKSEFDSICARLGAAFRAADAAEKKAASKAKSVARLLREAGMPVTD